MGKSKNKSKSTDLVKSSSIKQEVSAKKSAASNEIDTLFQKSDRVSDAAPNTTDSTKKSKRKAKSVDVAKNEKNKIDVSAKKIAAAGEIDDLFSSAKKAAPSTKEESESAEKEILKPKKRREKDEANRPYGIMKSTHGNDIVNPEAPLERIDVESGLPVYKAHLLKVGEGGGTPLCPFDCNCCF